MPRHSGSGGKWVTKSSGVKPVRHGKGRGKSRGLRTQASVPTLPQVAQTRFPKVQQPAAAQPERRRRRDRSRRRTDGQK